MPAPNAYPNLTHAGKGRPPGTKNKLTKKVWTIINRLVNDKEYVELLIDRIKKGRARHIEQLFLEHVLGKPSQDLTLKLRQNLGQTHIFLPKKDELPESTEPEAEPEAPLAEALPEPR